MKYLLRTFLLLAIITPTYAYDFQVGNLYYNITSNIEPYTVEVTYKDLHSDDHKGTLCIAIPSTVSYNNRAYTVTKIGDYAFRCSYSITSVEIPSSVTNIGDHAFQSCTSLISVSIPNTVVTIGSGAFHNCSSIDSILIPNSVTNIGGSAFAGCSSLTTIVIPNSITKIDVGTFQRCSSLRSINIPNTITYIGHSAFEECSSLTAFSIPNGVLKIEEKTFQGCHSLSIITIGNSVKEIWDAAFSECYSLSCIRIPKSVELIRNSFNGCYNLDTIMVEQGNSVYDSRKNCNAIIKTTTNALILGCKRTTIVDGIKRIEDGAFQNCINLSSIILPNTIEYIGSSAFFGCVSLTTISIPSQVQHIGVYAFGQCSNLNSIMIANGVKEIERYAFSQCSSLKTINIPNSVKNIGSGAFTGCVSLETASISNNVEYIKEQLFAGCSSLTSIMLGSSICIIESEAFEDCSNLSSITLPKTVTKLYDNVFKNCSILDTIYCYAVTPPAIEENTFCNYNANLYVACDVLSAYNQHWSWKAFKKIECIPSEMVETNDIIITPSANNVTITWPIETGADTYTIVIKNGNEAVCTLTFNADGQLLNIMFVPSRERYNHGEQYAEQEANGYQFTVTGLEQGTVYNYNIVVKDIDNQIIKTYSGEFTTEIQTAIEEITTENRAIQKLLRDNQFIIVHDGVEYDVMGNRQ